ncbi:MAG: hypothetical protein WD061_02400 [Candidatus Saccharimonadales bacterium]
MSKYKATVIKSGNSYALRVPKQYVEDGKLELGQKADIALPIVRFKQDRQRIQKIIKQLQEMGAYKQVEDPAIWQQALRQDRQLPGRDV